MKERGFPKVKEATLRSEIKKFRGLANKFEKKKGKSKELPKKKTQKAAVELFSKMQILAKRKRAEVEVIDFGNGKKGTRSQLEIKDKKGFSWTFRVRNNLNDDDGFSPGLQTAMLSKNEPPLGSSRGPTLGISRSAYLHLSDSPNIPHFKFEHLIHAWLDKEKPIYHSSKNKKQAIKGAKRFIKEFRKTKKAKK